MSGATGDSAPLPDGFGPGPGGLRNIRGCLPASAAAVVAIVAAVLMGLYGEDWLFGDDEEVSSDTSSTPTATPTSEPAAPTDTPSAEPTPTPSGPAGTTADLGGAFLKVDGQRITQAFDNAVDLHLTPAGLTGSLDLVLDSKLNFDEEEPVCFTVAVDIDEPLPYTDGDKGEHLAVDGKVKVVVGFTDGACRSANPARSETRQARLLFDYEVGKSDHEGVLALGTGDLLFSVGLP